MLQVARKTTFNETPREGKEIQVRVSGKRKRERDRRCGRDLESRKCLAEKWAPLCVRDALHSKEEREEQPR